MKRRKLRKRTPVQRKHRIIFYRPKKPHVTITETKNREIRHDVRGLRTAYRWAFNGGLWTQIKSLWYSSSCGIVVMVCSKQGNSLKDNNDQRLVSECSNISGKISAFVR